MQVLLVGFLKRGKYLFVHIQGKCKQERIEEQENQNKTNLLFVFTRVPTQDPFKGQLFAPMQA
jgi:hypothetical protein